VPRDEPYAPRKRRDWECDGPFQRSCPSRCFLRNRRLWPHPRIQTWWSSTHGHHLATRRQRCATNLAFWIRQETITKRSRRRHRPARPVGCWLLAISAPRLLAIATAVSVDSLASRTARRPLRAGSYGQRCVATRRGPKSSGPWATRTVGMGPSTFCLPALRALSKTTESRDEHHESYDQAPEAGTHHWIDLRPRLEFRAGQFGCRHISALKGPSTVWRCHPGTPDRCGGGARLRLCTRSRRRHCRLLAEGARSQARGRPRVPRRVPPGPCVRRRPQDPRRPPRAGSRFRSCWRAY